VIERGPISVAVNLAARPQRVPLRSGPLRLLLASAMGVRLQGAWVRLPPDSVAILKSEDH